MQKILHLIGVQDSIAVLTKIGTFRQIGKGVGGMAGDSRGLWCDFEKFLLNFSESLFFAPQKFIKFLCVGVIIIFIILHKHSIS